MTYKLYKTLPSKGEADAVMKTNENGSITSFLFDPANSDYQRYLAWVAEGNTPEPADTPSEAQALAACQAEAKARLEATDWSQVADVAAILENKAAFDTYRADVRALYLNPVAEPVWPARPEAVWSTP